MSIFRLALLATLLTAPSAVIAQDINLSLGDGSLTQTSLVLFALITVLSLAPGLAIMITCFPFVVTVLSILRQAIGLQQSPPNMLIVSLSLFLTYFVMAPVFDLAWNDGIQPFVDGSKDVDAAFRATMSPFREFMAARIEADTYGTLSQLRPEPPGGYPGLSVDSPLDLLIPSFLLSEVEKAFQIGFLIFLPFLIIDLVVAAVLMSMGMMMVPPAMVALPFKLAFFVVADGWTLVSTALVRGYF